MKQFWLSRLTPWHRIASTLEPRSGISKPGEDYSTEGLDLVPLEDAELITSKVSKRVAGSLEMHKIVLDIDLPALLIPSTTDGHFHLYIDHEIRWAQYLELLEVMAKVGLVERGYVRASRRRGFTAVRTPWTKKEAKADADSPR